MGIRDNQEPKVTVETSAPDITFRASIDLRITRPKINVRFSHRKK